MTISEFIRDEILLPRVKRDGVLVVYDPERRYRELCQRLETDDLQVVDATDNSIESRESASKALADLGAPNTDTTGLLVYVPAHAPVSDEDGQRDPFALYSVCGSVSPDGDGDEYLCRCLKAKPDHGTAIRRIFAEDANPGFAVIDAVGGGLGWPNLRARLGAESSRDILFALLVPDGRHQQALKEQDAWVAEARDLFKVSLGLTLKTHSKAWPTIADELWRFVLFSEFVFDLPETLPASLTDVPHAPDPARPLVQDLCDRLRNDQRTRVTYIDRAEAIEQDLDLPSLRAGVTYLGKLDTFPFEKRIFFVRTMEALTKDDSDQVRAIMRRHARGLAGSGKVRARPSGV